MPEYFIEFDSESKAVVKITKNGLGQGAIPKLTSGNQVPQKYFRMAMDGLIRCRQQTEPDFRVSDALIATLFSLVAIEAFTNTFFGSLSIERNAPELAEFVGSKDVKGISKRLRKAMKLAGLARSPQLDRALNEVARLEEVRAQIVHPKPELATLGFQNIMIKGLVENPFSLFEDLTFVENCFGWSVICVAETGKAIGMNDIEDIDAFVTRWTGLFPFSSDALCLALSVKK